MSLTTGPNMTSVTLPTRKPNEALPVAISMWGGFFATLLVLLAGMTSGTRPWVLLMRAGTTFLMVSAFLKLLTAGLIQVIQMRKTPSPTTKATTGSDDENPVDSITSSIRSTSAERKGVA